MRPLEARTKTSAELSRFLGIDEVAPEFIFTGLTSSTQFVQAGDLFVALPGARRHGAEFANEAFQNGAAGILTDKTGAEMLGKEMPSIIFQNPRLILGDLSAWFYNSPFRSLNAVGITGTNGKTTTASLLHQLWQLSKRECGFIGTVGISIGQEDFPSQFTTPESPELQAVVAAMV
jgi:UDP-N-acetylmuramoyl-L-alanyl-D-glutamate--2,6-diaminopimelate ligase